MSVHESKPVRCYTQLSIQALAKSCFDPKKFSLKPKFDIFSQLGIYIEAFDLFSFWTKMKKGNSPAHTGQAM